MLSRDLKSSYTNLNNHTFKLKRYRVMKFSCGKRRFYGCFAQKETKIYGHEFYIEQQVNLYSRTCAL